MNSSLRTGFWGDPSATIDWCEPNYQHSFYIAEFWNTITNLSFVVLALYGLARSMQEGFEWRFHMQFVAVMLLGLGSAMFHGTLQLVSQQCDETPMVWSALVWIYIVYDKEIRATGLSNTIVVSFMTAVGIGFAIAHSIYRFVVFFQLFWGALMILCCIRLCFHYSNVKDPRAREIGRLFLRNGFIAVGLWLMDYHLCQYISRWPVNPQGHAWWHIFLGISHYHGPLFMQYVRLEELQKHPKIVNKGFLVDTVTIRIQDKSKRKAL